MEYDRIKDILAVPIRRCSCFRRLAYKLFELGFLRVRHVKRELFRLLKSRNGEVHLFDAGFGFGPYMDFVLRSFPDVHVTGLEIKAEQVEDCTSFFEKEGFGDRINLFTGDLLTYRENEEYDIAIAIDILEHIEDDILVMRNLHQSLKPGGVLLIHTPASGVDSRLDRREEYFVGEHVRDGYLDRELKEKLLQAGFSRVELKYTYGKYGMAAWWIMQGIPLRLVHRLPLLGVIIPLYYILLFPFAHRLMLADLAGGLQQGKGLLVRAYK